MKKHQIKTTQAWILDNLAQKADIASDTSLAPKGSDIASISVSVDVKDDPNNPYNPNNPLEDVAQDTPEDDSEPVAGNMKSKAKSNAKGAEVSTEVAAAPVPKKYRSNVTIQWSKRDSVFQALESPSLASPCSSGTTNQISALEQQGQNTEEPDKDLQSQAITDIKDRRDARRVGKNEVKLNPKLKLVIAIASFDDKNPKNLSFAKGDVIQVLNMTGNWHLGFLHESSTYPITNVPLRYPSNYVKPVKEKSDPKLKPTVTDPNKAAKTESVQATVMAKSPYAATKAHRMSFAKGDIIKVVKNSGDKWHDGILIKSDLHALTGQVQRYPSTFVRSS